MKPSKKHYFLAILLGAACSLPHGILAEERQVSGGSWVENLDEDFYLPAITPEKEEATPTDEGVIILEASPEEAPKESLKENTEENPIKIPKPSSVDEGEPKVAQNLRYREARLRQLKAKLIAYLKTNKTSLSNQADQTKQVLQEASEEKPPLGTSAPAFNFTKKGMSALTVKKANLTLTDGKIAPLGANKVVKVLEKRGSDYLIEYEEFKGYLNESLLKDYTPEAFGKVVNEVPYISQLYPVYAPNGCEPTSMLMGLKAKGYTNIDLKTYLDKMPKDESNPKRGYVGVPYNTEYHRFQTIDPEPLAAYGRTYGAKTKSLQGEPIESVIKEVQNGNTVVLWATLYWQKPQYSTLKIEGVPTKRIFNNHVLLVTGYDPSKKAFYIADPYNHERLGANRKKPYYYWKSLKEVDEAYNYDNRRFAVAVR